MGTPLRLKRIGGSEHEVELDSIADGAFTVRIDGYELSAALEPLPDGSVMLTLGERRYHISGTQRANSILVAAGALTLEYKVIDARRATHHGGLTSPSVDAPMPGKVLKILVEEGARVDTNDPLIVLEAMKTETTLNAESPAVVRRVCVQVGQKVDHGATLIELGPVPQ